MLRRRPGEGSNEDTTSRAKNIHRKSEQNCNIIPEVKSMNFWHLYVAFPRLNASALLHATAHCCCSCCSCAPAFAFTTNKQHTQFFLRSFSVSIITTQCSSTFPHNNNNHTQASPTHTEPTLQHAGISCYFLFSETFSVVFVAARSHFHLNFLFRFPPRENTNFDGVDVQRAGSSTSKHTKRTKENFWVTLARSRRVVH